MQYLKDMFDQLGYNDVLFTEVRGIIYVNIHRSYIHYDELQVFCKLNSFKGISCVDGQVLIQFVA